MSMRGRPSHTRSDGQSPSHPIATAGTMLSPTKLPQKLQSQRRAQSPLRRAAESPRAAALPASIQTLAAASLPPPINNKTKGLNAKEAAKAREELSYAVFFPDLSLNEPLELQWEHLPTTATQNELVLNQRTSLARYILKRNAERSAESQTEALKRNGSSSSSFEPQRERGSTSSSLLSSISLLVHQVVDRLQMGPAVPSSSTVASTAHSTYPAEQPATIMLHLKGAGGQLVADSHWTRLHYGPQLVPKSRLDHLPASSFRTIETSNVESHSTQQFKRSKDLYLRYLEPNESDLEKRVEYDMDEQDACWLKLINQQRKAEEQPLITEDQFETVMDQLEKEWFHLTKDLQRLTQEPWSQEESVCNICNSGECENSNAIVFCDGCNLAVHQECYGVPYIPEGQWLCRPCMLSPEKPVKCIFCPNSGGAFKQTTTNKWGHLLCALWIPEVTVSNPVYMEPIDLVDRIPKSRWKLNCFICKEKAGACIQCYKSSCFTAFHVTCARKAGLYMKVKHTVKDDEDHSVYKAYCERHAPSSHRPDCLSSMNIRAGEEDLLLSDEEHNSPSKKPNVSVTEPSKSLRPTSPTSAYLSAKKRKELQSRRLGYNPSFPVAPEYILNSISFYLEAEKIIIRQRHKFLMHACRYWSLKRAARRGAPLLKRLHLEPWTAFSSAIKESESLMLERFKTLSHLRNDLERVRMLVDIVRKREKEKLKMMDLQMEYLYMKLRPLNCILTRISENLRRLDKYNAFAYPVDAKLVPDYYDIVKNPMDFTSVEKKVKDYQYDSFEDFLVDVELIISNALMYNKMETSYAKLALKLREQLSLWKPYVVKTLEKMKVDKLTGVIQGSVSAALFGEDKKVEICASVEKPTRRQPRQAESLKNGKYWDIVEVAEEAPDELVIGEENIRTTRRSSQPRDIVIPKKRTHRLDQESPDSKSAKKLKPFVKSPIDAHPYKVIQMDEKIKDYVRTMKRTSPDLKNKSKEPHVGSLAWGRQQGFPWFPMRIEDPNSNKAMLNIRQTKDEKLGRFFDRDMLTHRTWAWFSNDKIKVFDFGTGDVELLKAAQKAKITMRKHIVIAYFVSCLSINKDPRPQLELAGFKIAE